jgi:hypothetical protein
MPFRWLLHCASVSTDKPVIAATSSADNRADIGAGALGIFTTFVALAISPDRPGSEIMGFWNREIGHRCTRRVNDLRAIWD